MEVFNFMPYTYYTRMTVSGRKPAADSLQLTTDSGYMLQYRQLQIVFIEGGLAYV